MGYAYTPGLTVAEHTVVRKVRRLPVPGEVLVEVGQPVEPRDLVARAELPGDARPVSVGSKLGLAPPEVPASLLKRVGESVEAGEILARTSSLWGLFKSECRAPVGGTIEAVSGTSGQVIIRGAPTAVRREAYIRGRIVAVEPGESVTVEARGTLVQGVFGIGGEVSGLLEVVASDPGATLDTERIGPRHRGKIVVGGGLLTAAAVRAAVEQGVRGIVSGGIDDADLRRVLGYELGVAITGEEAVGITLVVTEGFGRVPMAGRTFELLRRRAGSLASMSGATQIRAGVIRPEVIIPQADESAAERPAAEPQDILAVGSAVRAIREPFFGCTGRCVGLPAELRRLESEARVRVLEVEFDDGRRAALPRANVELIRQ